MVPIHCLHFSMLLKFGLCVTNHDFWTRAQIVPQDKLYALILVFCYSAFILLSCDIIIYLNYVLALHNTWSSLLNIPFYFLYLFNASIKYITPFHRVFHDRRMPKIVLSISNEMIFTNFNIIFFLNITFLNHMLTLNLFHIMAHIILFSVHPFL